jgi:hypothetical protein
MSLNPVKEKNTDIWTHGDFIFLGPEFSSVTCIHPKVNSGFNLDLDVQDRNRWF